MDIGEHQAAFCDYLIMIRFPALFGELFILWVHEILRLDSAVHLFISVLLQDLVNMLLVFILQISTIKPHHLRELVRVSVLNIIARVLLSTDLIISCSTIVLMILLSYTRTSRKDWCHATEKEDKRVLPEFGHPECLQSQS
ncbi:hypothetical protein CPB84DRAFT_1754084 [Gymnopilus junonius]|uniref:Uncharacterized protein n=1 Tax=Gymnopilus junonius TaxID=109634 RepID=A0A9P5N813_GYMJU|nr:hypothetical protein CPB84DRAFT_1754084 [Gymnopilus junonius]